MSSKSDVWTLLLRRKGEWLSRQELEFVGGAEAMRRLREIRVSSHAAGYTIQSRNPGHGADEYRLVERAGYVSPLRPKCVKCGHTPTKATQPTIDLRWVTGYCGVCDKRDSIFRVPDEAIFAPDAELVVVSDDATGVIVHPSAVNEDGLMDVRPVRESEAGR